MLPGLNFSFKNITNQLRMNTEIQIDRYKIYTSLNLIIVMYYVTHFVQNMQVGDLKYKVCPVESIHRVYFAHFNML